jgi:hypothetical protein
MGIFSSKPSAKEVRDFGRGKTTSAKAAQAYARQQADNAAQRKAMAENRAARRKR